MKDVGCLICKDGVNMLETYLAKNKTKAEIGKELMNICSDIPFAEISTQVYGCVLYYYYKNCS